MLFNVVSWEFNMVLYGESPYRYGAYWGTISNHIKKQIHHIETILLRPCNSKNRHVVAIFEPKEHSTIYMNLVSKQFDFSSKEKIVLEFNT